MKRTRSQAAPPVGFVVARSRRYEPSNRAPLLEVMSIYLARTLLPSTTSCIVESGQASRKATTNIHRA